MPTTTYLTLDGEVLAETRAGADRDYLPDPLGSTAALLDSGQTRTDAFAYWPYGEERIRTGSTPTPFAFAGTLGYRRDSAARTYVRARTLRRDLARWQTVDPLWPQESAYGYARGGPTVWTDPSGLEASWNPPWLVDPNSAYRNKAIGCMSEAIKSDPVCKGFDTSFLYYLGRCIMGCETSDNNGQQFNPIPPDAYWKKGGKGPWVPPKQEPGDDDGQGYGPWRLTSANRGGYGPGCHSGKPGWWNDLCTNSKAGMHFLCRYLSGDPGVQARNPWGQDDTRKNPCLHDCMKALCPAGQCKPKHVKRPW